MALDYALITIYTGEEARHQGAPLHRAIVQKIAKHQIAARCLVTRATAGCYENGEIATSSIEVLSYHMPLKIEVILPAAELDLVLPELEAMVTDGILAVTRPEVRVHRATRRLIPRQLRVRDVMTAKPRQVSLQTPAEEIARILLDARFHGVPVVDERDHPVGIVTQGDLIARGGLPVRVGLLAALEHAPVDEALAALRGKTAEQLMSKPVVTVTAEMQLTEAVDLMLGRQLKRLPVVDGEGRLCGMLARVDVFHAISRETPTWAEVQRRHVSLSDLRYVRDVMDRETHQVGPETPIAEVIRIIDDSEIQRVAVVNAGHRLLGVISDRVLLAAFAGHRAGLWDYLLQRLPMAEIGRRHQAMAAYARARTAADVMQTELVTVREDALLEEAVRLMAQHQLKRLPVVDEEGVFRGMISRDGVLRAGVGPARAEPAKEG